MPQAIGAVVGAAIGAVFGGSVFAAGLSLAIGYATVAFALNKAMQLLAPRPKNRALGSGLEVSVTDSAADGYVIYGEVRCAGVNVIPPLSSGANGRYLHQVLALAIHEIDSFSDVYFNNETIANASIGAVTGTSSDGLVSGGTYGGVAWIRRYRGTATQTVDYILNQAFPTAFGTSFRGRGIAYAALQYDWGDGKVYISGVPQVTFLVRGKRCYDPRLDTTPGANPTNPSYIAWTDNPALCWADFMMANYGYAVSASEIDWSTVVSAANVCDASVTTPSGSQKRYTLNGRLSLGQSPEQNMRLIVDAMLGKVAYTGGQYRIFAGAWRTPAFTIEKSDWVSIAAIQTTAPRQADRWNGVVCYIVNRERNWQRVECYRRFSNTYQSADAGERIWIEIEQPLCTAEYEGQRKAEFVLRQSRNGMKLVGRLPPRFMKLRQWDNVSLNFDDMGWTGKTFTVSDCRLSPDGGVDVTLTEEQSSDWTDLSNAEYNAPSSATLPSTNPTAPSVPRDFSVELIDNTIYFSWNRSEVEPANTHYQLWSAPFSLSHVNSKMLVREGDFTAMTLPLSPTSMQWYQARAIANSYVSAFVPDTYGVGIQYVPPSGSWSIYASPASVSKTVTTHNGATSNVQIVVVGSNAPTFAWTRPTSVGISISNSTAQTVFFSVVSMELDEYRAGVWRCTVVDGTNSAYTDVNVAFFRPSI